VEDQPRRVAARVSRAPRKLRSWLAIDGLVVESLLQLAAVARAAGESARSSRDLHQFCERWAWQINSRLRRAAGGDAAACVTPLVLIIATAALAHRQGRPVQLREFARRQTPEGLVAFGLPAAAESN
jgi:hypothetical protein